MIAAIELDLAGVQIKCKAEITRNPFAEKLGKFRAFGLDARVLLLALDLLLALAFLNGGQVAGDGLVDRQQCGVGGHDCSSCALSSRAPGLLTFCAKFEGSTPPRALVAGASHATSSPTP
jgi:hypothetical protein